MFKGFLDILQNFQRPLKGFWSSLKEFCKGIESCLKLKGFLKGFDAFCELFKGISKDFERILKAFCNEDFERILKAFCNDVAGFWNIGQIQKKIMASGENIFCCRMFM